MLKISARVFVILGLSRHSTLVSAGLWCGWAVSSLASESALVFFSLRICVMVWNLNFFSSVLTYPKYAANCWSLA
ncbi:hypothetical protein RchiOBHm_Chr6g0274231 [Rosa chinensis]|uniref:Uncharacterized protein n=1 Tax=Rosa chinensis TaxID=74649 RepID=A0A2P6PRN7_ROSCH|nr:hypothetical protein RchiOBHm_Chr6g0274231 [Rosa chinensis]